MYKLITMHNIGSGDKGDFGENVHIILKRSGKGKDKRGDIWVKWDIVEEFSTNDYDPPWLAKEAAWAYYRKIK